MRERSLVRSVIAIFLPLSLRGAPAAGDAAVPAFPAIEVYLPGVCLACLLRHYENRVVEFYRLKIGEDCLAKGIDRLKGSLRYINNMICILLKTIPVKAYRNRIRVAKDRLALDLPRFQPPADHAGAFIRCRRAAIGHGGDGHKQIATDEILQFLF